MRGPIYVLVEGWITSKADGDRHFISAEKLANLYKVDIRKCGIVRENGLMRKQSNDVFLRPSYTGNYSLPPLPDSGDTAGVSDE